MFGIRRADRDQDAAAVGPLDAQADILERPPLAGSLVVDGERAVFQSKFAQVMAIEPGLTDAVDPRQQRGNAVGRRAWQPRSRLRRS